MFLQKYALYFSLAIATVAVLLSWYFYEQKVKVLQQGYENEKEALYHELYASKKAELIEQVSALGKKLLSQSQQIEQDATYEVTQALEASYEQIHALNERYKSVGEKRMQQKVIDLLDYGISTNMDDTLLLGDFQTNVIYAHKLGMPNEEFAQYHDAQGRSIALELVQKVQKYSQTYIYTTTPQQRRKLIYAKKLDLFEWYVALSIDLSERYKRLEEEFTEHVSYLAMQPKEFVALYDKEKKLFTYTKKGTEFDATYIDTVAQNLLKHNSWYRNELDTNEYYSVYLDSLGKYLIYGFARD